MSTTIRLSRANVEALAAGQAIGVETDRSERVHIVVEPEYREVRNATVTQSDGEGQTVLFVREGRLYPDGWLGFLRYQHLLDSDGRLCERMFETQEASPSGYTGRPTVGLWVDGPYKWFTLAETGA